MSLLAAGAAAKGAVSMLAMMAAQGTVLALLALVLVRAGKLRPAWSAAIWLITTTLAERFVICRTMAFCESDGCRRTVCSVVMAGTRSAVRKSRM